jgi:hypothetical protein
LVFIETSVFTKIIKTLLDDEEYRALQWLLVRDFKRGALIPGGGGLRKVRWPSRHKGKGKSGGVRVIYYVQSKDNLYMIFAYDKNERGDLSKGQLKHLRAYVRSGVL